MKIVPHYETSAAVIPSRVIECLNDATGDDMAVLIAALRVGEHFDPDETCRELGITKKTLDSALAFWERNGIISVEGAKRSGRSVPLGKKNVKTGDQWMGQYDHGLFPKNTDVVYGQTRKTLEEIGKAATK